MKFFKDNWIIIAIVVVLLILTNGLTAWKVDRFSKKEKRALKNQYDSLAKVIVKEKLVREHNEKIRKEIDRKDSILDVQEKQQIIRDKELIQKQKDLLNLYKNKTSKQLVNLLDSVYEANH